MSGNLDLNLRITAESTAGAVREIGKLGDEVAALGGDASKTTGEAAALAKKLDDLGRTEKLVNTFKAASSATGEAAGALGELQAQSQAAGDQQAILDGNLEKTRAALAQVAQASSELAADVQRSTLTLAQAEDAHADLGARVRQGVADSAAFSRAQAEAAGGVAQAQRALERSENAVQAGARSIAALGARLETARAAQRDLTNQVIAADEPTTALTARHQRATEKVEELQTRLGIAKVRYADLTAEVGLQQGALSAAEAEYSAAGEAAARQAAQVQTLRQSLSDAKAELDRKRVALTEQRQALRDVSASEVELERAVKSDEAALARNRKEVDKLAAALRGAEVALEQQLKELKQSELSLAAAGVDVANLTAEERRLQVQAAQTNIAMGDLRNGIARQRDDLVDVASKTRQLEDAQRKTQVSSEALGGGFTNLARGVLAYTGVNLGTDLIGELANQADAVRNVESRLRLATQSTEEFTLAQEGLLRIANGARTSYTLTADVYARVIQSTRELNLTQQQQLDITESIAKSLALSGASTQAQEAALVQLGQALQSGQLRGEEFNSVLEQAPRLAKALADGLKVTTGELREMAQQGQLTSAEVITALQTQGQVIRSEFERLDPTINGVITKIKNNFGQALAEFDRTNGVSDKAISALNAVAENMDELIQLATLAGNVTVATLGVKGVQAIAGFTSGLFKAEGGAVALAAAVSKIGLPVALGLVLEYADDLGRLAAKWTDVDDAARKAAENRRTQVQAEIDQQTEIAAKYLQYAQVRIKTGEEIAALSDAERESYREALANRLILENAERRRAVLMAELGTATQEQVRSETAGYQEIKAALQDIDNVQKGVLGQVSERAKQLAADFAEVGEEIGKVSTNDLSLLAARAAADLPAAQQLANQLGAEFVGAGRAGGEAGQEIAKRFSEANATILSLQSTLDAVRREQFRRLGVDAAEVLSGIDTDAKSLLATFDSLGSDAGTDVRLIEAAFKSLLKTLDSPEELEALKRSLAGVKAPAFDAATAVREIEKKLVQVRLAADPAAKAITDAFAAFGIQTRQQLDLAAAQAEQNFRRVVASGQATAVGLTAAFEQYARAQIEAGRPVIASTEAQRLVLEQLRAEYERKGNAAETSAARAIAANRAEADSLSQLGEAARRARIEKESLTNAANRVTNLKDVAAAAASIDGRGAVGFGAAGIERLAEIEQQIRQAVRAGRLASDALGDTRIDSPADIAAARRQLRDAQGLASRLGSVTGSQAVEARTLSEELERGAAALERAIARFEREAVSNGGARTVPPGTTLGREQIVFNPGGGASPQQPAPLPTPQPIQTIRVELVIGQQVIPGLFTQSDAQRLVDLLERDQLNGQGR